MRIYLLPPVLLIALLFSADASASAQTDTTLPSRTPHTDNQSIYGVPVSVDPVAAAIGVFSIIVTIGAALWGISKGKEATEQAKRADRAEAEARALGKRLFYKAGLVKWEVQVKDLDGLLEATCNWEDIKILPLGETLANIAGEVWFSPHDSKILEYPTLIRHSFQGEKQITREVRLDSEPDYDYGCNFILRIINSIPYSHMFSYSYRVTVSKGVYMNREEVEKKAPKTFKKEYWAHTVVTPVDKIVILVNFPEAYRPAGFYAGICAGDNPSDDTMRGDELNRMTDAGKIQFEPSNNWARLTVEEPYVGFTYLIYWLPPKQSEIDPLRPREVSSAT